MIFRKWKSFGIPFMLFSKEIQDNRETRAKEVIIVGNLKMSSDTNHGKTRLIEKINDCIVANVAGTD